MKPIIHWRSRLLRRVAVIAWALPALVLIVACCVCSVFVTFCRELGAYIEHAVEAWKGEDE
jgi:hypothetical protein